MAISHAVSGRNLVSHLLKRCKAAFAVEVSAPYATYRRVCLAEAGDKVELVQTVSWDAKDVVPPVYVRPLVISTVAKTKRLELNGRHGVHDVWQGVEVEIGPGAILAARPVLARCLDLGESDSAGVERRAAGGSLPG